jgi:hypothetical protein
MLDHEQAHQKTSSIMKAVHVVLNKLNSTESKILLKIQENSNFPFSEALPGTVLKVCTEDELFENMKSSYSLYIDLHRSFNRYLKEVSEPADQLLKFIRVETSKQIRNSVKKELFYTYS